MKATRKFVSFSITGLMAAGAFGFFGGGEAQAVDQPVTFEVTGGTLAIAQTPTAGTALVQGSAVEMPVTTVTDGRAEFLRTGAWTVTVTASQLAGIGTAAGAFIAADQMTMDETGSFTFGTGTRVNQDPVVATGALVSATGDSIGSVYTYTPTVRLALQTSPFSGSYTGTITQTVA